jgi:hypothetical protein
MSMCELDGMVVLVRRISQYNDLSVGIECGIEVGRERSRVFLRGLYRFHIVLECNSDVCLIRTHTTSHRPFVIPSHSPSPSLTAQNPPILFQSITGRNPNSLLANTKTKSRYSKDKL